MYVCMCVYVCNVLTHPFSLSLANPVQDFNIFLYLLTKSDKRYASRNVVNKPQSKITFCKSVLGRIILKCTLSQSLVWTFILPAATCLRTLQPVDL